MRLTVPIGDILVRDPRCHVEHDDAAMSVDVIAISQSTEFLLPRRVPHVKDDLSQVLSPTSMSAGWVDGSYAMQTYSGKA